VKTTVLDASALLALLYDEAGAEKVENLFLEAEEADKPMLIASVNWAEVVYKMQRKTGVQGLEVVRQFESTMPLAIEPMDRELAEAAAGLKVAHGLGLADAFAAALARQKKADLVTADTEFKAVEKEIKINWLK
jgi:PIN domain nuclease of toxin-antitoxin system